MSTKFFIPYFSISTGRASIISFDANGFARLADAHRRRPGEHHFQHVARAAHAAHADYRYLDGFVDLPHHAHGNREHRSSREAARHIGEHGAARRGVDAHGEDSVDEREAVGPGVWKVSGGADIEEVAEALDVKLPEDREFDTLGGLVFDQLSVIPEDGSKVEVDTHGLHIKVESIVDRRVDWALVSKCQEEEESQA